MMEPLDVTMPNSASFLGCKRRTEGGDLVPSPSSRSGNGIELGTGGSEGSSPTLARVDSGHGITQT